MNISEVRRLLALSELKANELGPELQEQILQEIGNLRSALELVSMGLADSVDNPECYAIVKEGNKKIPDPERAGKFLRELLSQTGCERY